MLSFADLPYPDYEVLLGVRSRHDPAYPLAWMAARRWPQRFRVVVQEGEAGLNPKVNQLVTLARHARHDLLVISDSNTRVERDYLDEIAAHLGDPTVGLVTHPLAGDGEREAGARLGAIADNLHLTGAITPAVVTAKLVCRKDYVVGKSMAMRRADIDALGGFASVKDVLAEDFVLGRAVVARLGKRVVLGRSVVTCVSVRRPLDGFFRRYARWNVMQHQCAGLAAYLGLLLENPGSARGGRRPRRSVGAQPCPRGRVRARAAWQRTPSRDGCCAGAASRCKRCSPAAPRTCFAAPPGFTAS